MIDLRLSDDCLEPAYDAVRAGYLNVIWSSGVPLFGTTDSGDKLLQLIFEEASNVPDDPIALQAQAELWKERALKAEAKILPAHNHDIDPSCREFTRQGVTLGECMLKEFKRKETQ